MDLKKFGILEIVLIEVILLCIVWLLDDYSGSLLSLFLGLLFLSVLIISYIVEAIEKSKVPKWYYRLLFFSFLACIGVLIIFTVIKGGQFDWMNGVI